MGRQALVESLPELKREYTPDVIVANVENSAHGKGVTVSGLEQLGSAGVQVFTSGNHVFRTGKLAEEAFKEFPNLIRPHNYGESLPGTGFYKFQVGGVEVAVVNLNGTTFFEKQFPSPIANPFACIDALLDGPLRESAIILVDFHAEATSEKVAMGWYLDGRVSALLGTHTHIPTADEWALPQGLGYVTDVGMCGARDSVIGVKVENVVSRFTGGAWLPMEPAEGGSVVLNAMYLEISGLRTTVIKRIKKII